MVRTPTLIVPGFLATLTVLSVAAAAPGNLDPTFAGKGWVNTREFFPNYDQ
jgi:hypothetical protein